MVRSKNLKLATIIGFVLIGIFLFYYKVDPRSNNFLIKCTFKTITGLECPGCGSQRALHAFLHGELKQAYLYNPLFIIFIPYVSAGILFEWFHLKYTYPKIRKLLFGKIAIFIILIIVIFFFIYRNI